MSPGVHWWLRLFLERCYAGCYGCTGTVATDRSKEGEMPRKPNGKRVVDARGGVSVRAKNGNGQGSVFFAETENAWRAS